MPNLSTRNAAICILLLLTILSGCGSLLAFKWALNTAGITLMTGSFSGAWSSLMLALNGSHSEPPVYIQGFASLPAPLAPAPAPEPPATQPEK